MKALDPGHFYRLQVLDGLPENVNFLQFVKRVGQDYPGNGVSYRGTNCQEVLRAVNDRCLYMHLQKPHWVNPIIRFLLRTIIWLFEFRAARRRGHGYWHMPQFAIDAPTCPVCGHTDCRKSHSSLSDIASKP